MAQTKNISITPASGIMQKLYVSQNDVGRTVLLNVTDGAGYYDLTGLTAKLVGTKPSGLGFTVEGEIDGHTVEIVTTKQMTDEHGNIPTELRLEDDNDNVIGSANFILAVERDPHPDDTTVDGSVDTLIPELKLLVERAEAASATSIESAAAAAQDADDAEASATQAASSANTAAQAATAAGNAATNAAASEANADAAADAAEDSATAAGTAATSAAASAAAAAQVLHEYGDITFSLNAEDNGIDITLTVTP